MAISNNNNSIRSTKSAPTKHVTNISIRSMKSAPAKPSATLTTSASSSSRARIYRTANDSRRTTREIASLEFLLSIPLEAERQVIGELLNTFSYLCLILCNGWLVLMFECFLFVVDGFYSNAIRIMQLH